jgi:hypothetical protein
MIQGLRSKSPTLVIGNSGIGIGNSGKDAWRRLIAPSRRMAKRAHSASPALRSGDRIAGT